MKTLNEVIEELNIWDAYGDEYPDVFYDTQTIMDALYYLREYRDKHDEMLKTEEALGYCEMAENRPLTWGELRTMEGKPVWVEEKAENGLWWTYWVIWEGENAVLPKEKYGTDWQAYRKERHDSQ